MEIIEPKRIIVTDYGIRNGVFLHMGFVNYGHADSEITAKPWYLDEKALHEICLEYLQLNGIRKRPLDYIDFMGVLIMGHRFEDLFLLNAKNLSLDPNISECGGVKIGARIHCERADGSPVDTTITQKGLERTIQEYISSQLTFHQVNLAYESQMLRRQEQRTTAFLLGE
jgi:hypothetical protein